ncbi:hypothetical protein GCM10007242_20800 [Pigmentiphaga litoralis]|uniref:ureidoglycolate lyase n=1 Tax=Pigmentiphaga litoralis TaxID=516702 RepID=UPI00198BADCC|nr:ureidoglycolate lyase [Pigmentiphaga litoralis]GGX14266.1 hypothetical protein GCM10007242_20800 [Pigmentiphaga litoralis]
MTTDSMEGPAPLLPPRAEPPLRPLQVEPLDPSAFLPYGQVMAEGEDGVPFGPDDAQLLLDRGIPRFYVMRLDHRPWEATRLTRHQQVTQCLASVGGTPWCLVVAPPSSPAADTPALSDIRAFLIPGNVAVMLKVGTWHAGPYFEGATASFFNLELSDTNVVDHDNLSLVATCGAGLSFATGNAPNHPA